MTENHDYNTPSQGTRDWHTPLNENFERLDVDVPIRDDNDQRTNYKPKAGSMFIAIDTGDVYRGDGATWVSVGSISGGSGSSVSEEEVRDTVASFVVEGTNMTITHNDANNTLTFDASGASYTDEDAQDAVGNAIVAGNNINYTYDDANNELEFSVDATTTHREHIDARKYGTDTSDRDRVLEIPAVNSGDQMEVLSAWSSIHGSTTENTSLTFVAANGESNLSDTLPSADTTSWYGNEVVSGDPLLTTSTDTSLFFAVENDTGADVIVDWGFEYRVI